MKPYKLRLCAEMCVYSDISCPNEDCKHWINYEEDNNCTLIAIDKNASMTLDQVGKRLGISLVSVKKIEDKVKARLKNSPVITIFSSKK